MKVLFSIRLVFCLTLIMNLNAFGQVCSSEDDGIRLDGPGGPLENFRLQDQDGIGWLEIALLLARDMMN